MWKIPKTEQESLVLYHVMRLLSHLMDFVLLVKGGEQYPKTGWPRIFAKWENLLVVVLTVTLLVLFFKSK